MRLYALVAAFVVLVGVVLIWRETREIPPEPGSRQDFHTVAKPPSVAVNGSSAAPFLVTSVADGDTFRAVGQDGIEFDVRTRGMDAPELGQKQGWEAKDRLERLILNKRVELNRVSRDKYGRLLADVILDGKQVGHVLVADGLAWADRSADAIDLREAEALARQARAGLWSDESPVEPWVWRQRGRP